MACNDYIILDSCIYRILQRHFSKCSYYTQLMELFHEVPPSPPSTPRPWFASLL